MVGSGATHGPRSALLALVATSVSATALASAGPAPGELGPGAPAPIAAEMVGITPEGHLGVLVRHTGGGGQLVAQPLSGGGRALKVFGAYPRLHAHTYAHHAGWRSPEIVEGDPATGWQAFGLHLRPEDRGAPGGRRSVIVWAEGHGQRRRVLEVPDVHGVRLGPLLATPDPTRFVLEVRQGGVISLRVLTLARPRAELENLAAIADLRAGRRAAAHARLEAARARDPGFADTTYNLACVRARAGDLGIAEDELAWALAIAPRLARLARSDPDLAVLRARPRTKKLLNLDD